MGTITVGVDLAKQVFSVCVVDGGGRVGERRDLKREAFAAWLVQLPPETVVAMEACSGAHRWARSDLALRRALADEAIRRDLPAMLHGLLDDLQQHWNQLRERIGTCDVGIATHAKADVRSQRAQQLIGVGPLTADAIVATIGDGRQFTHGRQLSAWLGLTPTQHSSGGKQRLGEISRRGDSYLRTLLIQGARSSLQRANAVALEKASAEQIWIRGLTQRLPFGKVLVAIANKHARQLWAMLARDEDYDAEAWLRHPMVQRPATHKTHAMAA